jgi:hypothetical protein
MVKRAENQYICIDLTMVFKGLLLTLALAIISAIGYGVFKGWKGVVRAHWDGDSVISYVEINDQPGYTVYAYHPKEDVLKGIIVPSETMFPVAKGFGEYQVANIEELGEIEGIGGPKLLAYSFQNFLKAPIDGWIVKKNQFLPFLWKSNFTWWDKLRIFFKTRGLKISQKKIVNLRTEGFLKEEQAADGSNIWRLKEGGVYDASLRVFGEEQILTEGLKVTVVNGTNHSFMAKRVAQLLKSIGVQVVSTGNSEDIYQQTVIRVNNRSSAQDTYTFNRIQQVFLDSRVEPSGEVEADFELIIGEDFWKKYYSSKD